MPKEDECNQDPNSPERTIIAVGKPECIEAVKKEILCKENWLIPLVLTRQKSGRHGHDDHGHHGHHYDRGMGGMGMSRGHHSNDEPEGYSTPGIEKLHHLSDFMTTQ